MENGFTIAKPVAGMVVLKDNDVEIAPFQVLCFPKVKLGFEVSQLRELLRGHQGYFVFESQSPSALATLIESNENLSLRFDTHGGRVEPGIRITGGPTKQTLPGKESPGDRFDFVVENDVYVTEPEVN